MIGVETIMAEREIPRRELHQILRNGVAMERFQGSGKIAFLPRFKLLVIALSDYLTISGHLVVDLVVG
jgi:hypothetical protein